MPIWRQAGEKFRRGRQLPENRPFMNIFFLSGIIATLNKRAEIMLANAPKQGRRAPFRFKRGPTHAENIRLGIRMAGFKRKTGRKFSDQEYWR
ncbi:hypothetical protein [Marinobacter bohaiensis]|uniref:hypothetical protein n=1 Tax=Marinobacter bohaiensis TaxID=2201898 RepID=UPI0013A6C1F9|nr:hypothetical protein [Marinobacter bohaiensis]